MPMHKDSWSPDATYHSYIHDVVAVVAVAMSCEEWAVKLDLGQLNADLALMLRNLLENAMLAKEWVMPVLAIMVANNRTRMLADGRTL